MAATKSVSAFLNRADGKLLILKFGVDTISRFVVGVGSFVEIPKERIKQDGGREILAALEGFPWPDTESRCELETMTPAQRRKFHKAHDEVMIWEDRTEGPVLRITAMVQQNNGAVGDTKRKKVISLPATESQLMNAVLSVITHN